MSLHDCPIHWLKSIKKWVTGVVQRKVWQTLAMRLAIRQSIFLSGLTLIAMLLLYWLLNSFVLAQISSDLSYNLGQLTRIQEQQGQTALVASLHQLKIDNQTRGHGHRYYLLRAKNGTMLAGDLRNWPEGVVLDGRVTNILLEEEDLPRDWMDVDEGFWPSIATQFQDGSMLLITQSIDSTEQLKDFTLMVMALLFSAVMFISLLLGWLLGNRMLQRIDPINQTARAIESGDLSLRVKMRISSTKQDEFEELAAHLNRMLDTIETLMHEVRQVNQNIAHDLRKPLTRIQTRLEQLQTQTIIYPESLSAILDDMDALGKTFNALLQLGKIESGVQRVHLKQLNLSELCQNLGELYHDMAIQKGLVWKTQIDDNIWVSGDRQLLAQAAINLLENALNYTPKGKKIVLKLSPTSSQRVMFSIANGGVSLNDQELKDIMKPFVRLDCSRSGSGNGLGLALVKAICEVHESNLQLTMRSDSFIAEFSLIQANKVPLASSAG